MIPRAVEIAAGLPTAGAIPIRTAKGEMTMQKVKVQRYVAGKRPAYAPDESDSDLDPEEEESGAAAHRRVRQPGGAGPRLGFNLPRDAKQERESSEEKELREPSSAELQDRRLQRLAASRVQPEPPSDSDEEEEELDRVERHRRLREPELLEPGGGGGGGGEEEDEEEEELDEEELEARRAALRQRAKREEEELLELEEEPALGGEAADDDDDDEEYTEEEYTDSDEDDLAPRLKPVFVRSKERVTVQERRRAAAHQEQREGGEAVRREAELRRRATLRLVQEEARQAADEAKAMAAACDALRSDEEDPADEEAYEAWKLRELRRIRRDREAREARAKEQAEVEALRNLTEAERREELRRHPKVVTNAAPKGKYRYLQKYYHRGAFYLDGQESVLARDVAQPTLEDKFDKTVLPKVMQVKNFGRAGRTKYTHLVDQDTAGPDQREGMWQMDTAQSRAFHEVRGGGMKQSFERPSGSKRRRDV